MHLAFHFKTLYLHFVTEKEKFACDPKIWVDKYSDEFFRFAMYRVKNREVAEDLVQARAVAVDERR